MTSAKWFAVVFKKSKSLPEFDPAELSHSRPRSCLDTQLHVATSPHASVVVRSSVGVGCV